MIRAVYVLRRLPNLSREEFCKLYDCFGSQKVIIKFDLKEKENT